MKPDENIQAQIGKLLKQVFGCELINADKVPMVIEEAFEVWFKARGEDMLPDDIGADQINSIKAHMFSLFFAGASWSTAVPATQAVAELDRVHKLLMDQALEDAGKAAKAKQEKKDDGGEVDGSFSA